MLSIFGIRFIPIRGINMKKGYNNIIGIYFSIYFSTNGSIFLYIFFLFITNKKNMKAIQYNIILVTILSFIQLITQYKTLLSSLTFMCLMFYSCPFKAAILMQVENSLKHLLIVSSISNPSIFTRLEASQDSVGLTEISVMMPFSLFNDTSNILFP